MITMNETSEKDYIRWLFLAFTLLVLCFPVASDALSLAKYEPGFSIAQVVDDSDLVLLGQVIEVRWTGNFTTDITVKVDELIIRLEVVGVLALLLVRSRFCAFRVHPSLLGVRRFYSFS